LDLHDTYQTAAMDYNHMFQNMELCDECLNIKEFCSCIKKPLVLQGFIDNIKNIPLAWNLGISAVVGKFNTHNKVWRTLAHLTSTPEGQITGHRFIEYMANEMDKESKYVDVKNEEKQFVHLPDNDLRSTSTKILDKITDSIEFIQDKYDKHQFIIKCILGTISVIGGLCILKKMFSWDSPIDPKCVCFKKHGTKSHRLYYTKADNGDFLYNLDCKNCSCSNKNDVSNMVDNIELNNLHIPFDYEDNTDFEPQGVVGSKPEPMLIERDNVWVQKDYSLTKFDLTDNITSNSFPLEKILEKNVIFISFIVGSKAHFCRGLCIGGHLYMFNNHTIPNLSAGTQTIIIQQEIPAGGVSSNVNLILDEKQLYRMESKDLCFIELNNLPAKRNIEKMFPENTVDANFDGFILSRNECGLIEKTKVFNMKRTKCDYPMKDKEGFVEISKYKFDCFVGFVMKPTKPGDCGSVYVAETRMGKFIVGLHQSGSGSDVACILVSQNEIKSAKKRFNRPLFSPNKPSLECKDIKHNLVDLNPKSEVRFLQEGHAHVYGSFSNSSFRGKSRVVKTAIEHIVTKYGYKTIDAKPCMNSWEPYHLAVKEMVCTTQKFSQSKIDMCRDSYIKHIISNIDKKHLDMCHPYDINTAINGVDGVAYVDSIKWSTSMGFPWNKSKKLYKEGELGNFRFTQEIMDRIQNVFDTYDKGLRYSPIFSGALKDEVVSQEKHDLKKTRLFSGAPVDFSIAYRMLFLPLIRMIQNNKFIFEMAVGTIAQSKEWHHIYKYVTKHGIYRMVAGDFSKFDKKMPSQFIMAAFDVLIEIAKLCKYSEKDIFYMYGMAEDISYSFVNIHGTLYEFFGTNPSGHPLTVIINSIVNSLYMRYMYLDLNPKQECVSFAQNVALMTYGDDNMFSVSADCNWFNHTTIQDNFAKYDIKYTMADKNSISRPYISIHEISFLKRSFKFDYDLNYYVAPLEEASINRALTMCVASNEVTPMEQSIGTLTNVVREYFWYGKEIYNDKVNLFKRVYDEAVLEKPEFAFYAHKSMFPLWEELAATYLQMSEKVDTYNSI